MKIYADKLSPHLSRIGEGSDPSVHVVAGDEPLLVQESSDAIRHRFRQAGYEREIFHVDGNFKWEDFLFSANSMSLFAEQKLLEVRIPGGKPGDAGSRALLQFLQEQQEGVSLLLVMPRIDAPAQRSKWFKALDAAGLVVQVYPIERSRLPGWVNSRFRQVGLKASREAVEALTDRIEGNLLAAVQEIERLRLVIDGDTVELSNVVDSVANASRYDVFALTDAAVAQDVSRTLRVIQGLRTEGAELLMLIAMLAREIRSLASMRQDIDQGQGIDTVVNKHRVWNKRQPIVKKCLSRLQTADLAGLEQQVARIDRMVKGMEPGDPWIVLTDLLMGLAGRPPRVPYALQSG
jgi:DNA polymerase-3 subunit delta